MLLGMLFSLMIVLSAMSTVADSRRRKKPGRLTITLGKRMYREVLPDHQ